MTIQHFYISNPLSTISCLVDNIASPCTSNKQIINLNFATSNQNIVISLNNYLNPTMNKT